MNTMTITETEAKRYGFPAKAIGYWAVVEETDEYKVLHKLTKDGRIRSDRPNNILKVKKLANLEEFFKAAINGGEKLLTATASNGETVVIARTHTVDMTVKPKNDWKSLNVGIRKSRWIEQLLEMMKSEPFTGQFLEKLGETKFVEQVLKDTAPDRDGGKAYSSIDSAMRVWNLRIRKGVEYGDK